MGTFKAAANDDAIMLRQKGQAQRRDAKKMGLLFKAADDTGDGKLSYEEVLGIMKEPLCKAWLSNMDLDASDVKTLFREIDTGDGSITSDELCAGVAKLKGSAKRLEMKLCFEKFEALQKTSDEMMALLAQLQESVEDM